MPDSLGNPVDRLPEEVRFVVERYLALVDLALPGRIEALYLVGSVALDDYQTGQSDIDFVGVTASPLSSAELSRLAGVHGALLGEVDRPWFDGLYLMASDLARNPEVVHTAPHVHEGRFDASRGFEANPAVWLTLRNHPYPVRGRISEVRHDPEHLRRWTVNNLNTYWAGVAAQLEGGRARLSDDAASRAIVWCIPGVARLAYTLATGDVTSKSGACHWVLATYPERWHSVASQALAIRHGTQPQSTSLALLEAVISFVRFVVKAANDGQDNPAQIPKASSLAVHCCKAQQPGAGTKSFEQGEVAG